MKISNFFNQIDLTKLLDQKRIFEIKPDPQGLYWYLLVLFILFLVLGLYLRQSGLKKKLIFDKKVFLKSSVLFITTSLIGMFLVFCRYESFSYLGSRIMQMFLGIVFVFWGLEILSYKYLTVPKEKKKFEERQRFEKYLPRKKSNK